MVGGVGFLYFYNKYIDFKQFIVDNNNIGLFLIDDIIDVLNDGG